MPPKGRPARPGPSFFDLASDCLSYLQTLPGPIPEDLHALVSMGVHKLEQALTRGREILRQDVPLVTAAPCCPRCGLCAMDGMYLINPSYRLPRGFADLETRSECENCHYQPVGVLLILPSSLPEDPRPPSPAAPVCATCACNCLHCLHSRSCDRCNSASHQPGSSCLLARQRGPPAPAAPSAQPLPPRPEWSRSVSVLRRPPSLQPQAEPSTTADKTPPVETAPSLRVMLKRLSPDVGGGPPARHRPCTSPSP